MTVRLYRSTDASAPTLNGQAGSLTAVLDACLVNGYGSQTAAGWSIAYTATNRRAYKQGAGGNHPSGIHLYVDDTAPGGGLGREARVCGFETMSAITPVGTGQFPNNTQSAIGVGCLVIRKSATTTADARTWYLIADAHTFYLFVETGDAGVPAICGYSFMFGDFKSYKSGDAYAQIIIGRTGENSAARRNFETMVTIPGTGNYGINRNMAGHFMCRHWNQLTPSVRCGKMPGVFTTGTSNWGGDNQVDMGSVVMTDGPGCNYRDTNHFPYPNPIDGAMWMTPFWVNQNGIRGYLKGLWNPAHHLPLNPGDTFTAANGNLAGKSFIAVPGATGGSGDAAQPAQFFVEYSDTWPA